MNTFRSRMIFVACLMACLGGLIFARLVNIQIVHGKEYALQSRKQSQQRLVIKAKRGRILDRKNRILASNVDNAVTMSMRSLAFIPDDTTAKMNTRPLSGNAKIGRVYPYGSLAAPVLGYVGKDGYGLGGMEFAFDRYLRGEDGWEIIQRDALIRQGRQAKYRMDELPEKQPINGADVVTTIDLNIQKISESVLKQTITRFNAHGGMAMVLEPSTGKVLAMVTVPGFNPNIPQAYSSDLRANKCISWNYEPGSTFKIITAAAALEQKVKKESDTIDGNMGSFEIYNEKIRDHKPYGRLSFAQAMAYSSNVCFAKVANELGNDRLYSYTLNFGLGSRTGIMLPGEESGIVHPVSKWSGRTRVTMAIGQEVSATFLQMMLAYAAIANHGLLVEPRIYERIVSSGGTVLDTSKARTVRRIVSRDVARRLLAMLAGAVEYGTGVNASLKNVTVAGKTGTSQKLNEETGAYSNFLSYASFIGCVPADDPVLVAGIVIDEPANAEYGGTAAAPAFKQIITQIISNPYLEFAEQILRNKPALPDTGEKETAAVPLICGMTRSQAEHLLKGSHVRFEVFGAGDTVTGQSPDAGQTIGAGSTVIVYAHRKGNPEARGARYIVPDCRGRDLHDALNILNIKGIVPYVTGAGTVRSQNPGVGSLIRQTDVCTLFCSFDG